MMTFVEVTKRALMLTLLLALREAAAGALVQAMGRFSKTTSPTTTESAQVARYAVVTQTLENKEKVEVNMLLHGY